MFWVRRRISENPGTRTIVRTDRKELVSAALPDIARDLFLDNADTGGRGWGPEDLGESGYNS